MKLSEEKWVVRGCGNPNHGPTWACHKVLDASGHAVLSGVTKDVADKHAALPAAARTLLDLLDGEEHTEDCLKLPAGTCTSRCLLVIGTLRAMGELP